MPALPRLGNSALFPLPSALRNAKGICGAGPSAIDAPWPIGGDAADAFPFVGLACVWTEPLVQSVGGFEGTGVGESGAGVPRNVAGGCGSELYNNEIASSFSFFSIVLP